MKPYYLIGNGLTYLWFPADSDASWIAFCIDAGFTVVYVYGE